MLSKEFHITKVHLRPITIDNLSECLNLQLDDSQVGQVATNAKSLAEAYVNRNLVPLAIYPAAARGYEQPTVPIVGFTVYELSAGVGFILRLMIDRRYQRQGYAQAAMHEVIRRLKLHPEAEMIATSHQRGNAAAAKLYHSLGFVLWEIEWARAHASEVFLYLAETI